jgi:hypothetical protein
VLLLVQGGGFPRGTHGHQRIGPVLDMKIDQPSQAVIVDGAILLHGGDQRHYTALNHYRILHTRVEVDMVLTPPCTDKVIIDYRRDFSNCRR